MSSTSTFQGMNTESKPSSRVLAPPGGGSSNIFGSTEPTQAPPKRESAPPKQEERAPAPQSNQGERFIRAAPKQGEDSFQNIFGSEKCLNDKNSPLSGQRSRSKPVGHTAGSNQSSPSTFDSLFGHANVEIRKKSASDSKKPSDSFNRVFGQKDGDKHIKCQVFEDTCQNIGNLSLKTLDSPHVQTQSSDEHDSSFHRVFGGFQGDSPSARGKRHSDINCAYNPITGQPYDMPEEKKKTVAESKEEEEEKEVGKENEQKLDTTPQPAVAAGKEKTSTRIAQPPGGKSSGLW